MFYLRIARSWFSRVLALSLLFWSGPASSVTLDEGLRNLKSADVLVADAAVEEIVAHGPPGADALLALLDDSRRDVRAGAIRGLGLLGEARAGAPLRATLAASLDMTEPDTMNDRYFRILTIQALGRIGSGAQVEGSAELLRRAAEEGDSFERAHAAISLFLIREDPGYDLVRESLADTTMAIRALVVEGLGRSKDDRARDLILSKTTDDSWVVRDGAYRALTRWQAEQKVMEALRNGADDPSWYVRETIRELVGNEESR